MLNQQAFTASASYMGLGQHSAASELQIASDTSLYGGASFRSFSNDSLQASGAAWRDHVGSFQLGRSQASREACRTQLFLKQQALNGAQLQVLGSFRGILEARQLDALRGLLEACGKPWRQLQPLGKLIKAQLETSAWKVSRSQLQEAFSFELISFVNLSGRSKRSLWQTACRQRLATSKLCLRSAKRTRAWRKLGQRKSFPRQLGRSQRAALMEASFR